MNIPFIDLKTQYRTIQDKIRAGLDTVLEHGRYIMGPEIQELEERLAGFCGQKHAVACSSGTDALIMALMALDIRQGDAVLTTPFTFFATAEAIAFIGAVPVFVDIEEHSFNISPDLLEKTLHRMLDQAAGPAVPGAGNTSMMGHRVPDRPVPKAVISVDLFGLPCNYSALEKICQKYGLRLIVDAAQSLGAVYQGKSTCALGDAACTSFFPAKPLGCYGDGGMCFTRDLELNNRLRSLRMHGQGKSRHESVRLGLNARMDSIQAAVLLAKLEIFEHELDLRRQKAALYNSLLQDKGGITVPWIPWDMQSAWAQYSILTNDQKHREAVFQNLDQAGIPWAVYYPVPLHLQQSLAYLGYEEGSFPVCENISRRILSLPMHPYLTQEQQESIASSVVPA
ncbi:MAG: DegT/DnrJ/EryC1/StrS family aminotransferase [Desulfonatronovibrionaceae bacterium]